MPEIPNEIVTQMPSVEEVPFSAIKTDAQIGRIARWYVDNQFGSSEEVGRRESFE